VGFFHELFASRGGERIEARLAVVDRYAPLAGDPAALLETLQRGIERSVLDEELLVGGLLDGVRDALAVLRPPDEGAEDQQIQRALQQLELFLVLSGQHLTQESKSHL